MGADGLSELFGPTVLDIVFEIDAAANTSQLIPILLDIYSPFKLLNNNKKRQLILKYLDENDAKELLEIVGLDYTNIWSSLGKIDGRFKSKVFEFFEVDVEEQSSNLGSGNEVESQESVSAEYALFPHQEQAIQELKEIRSKGKDRVLLHMPTGAGKTRTSMNFVVDFIRSLQNRESGSIVLWFADTEELCEQAAQEFKRAWSFLGVGEINLYRSYRNLNIDLDTIESGFVVFSLQKFNSILKRNQSAILRFSRKLKLVIFDEAHKILAPTYMHATELIQATSSPFLIGLSATPGRATFDHQENKKFAEFFGFNKVTLSVDGYDSPVAYLQEQGYLAKQNYHRLPFKPEDLVMTSKEMESLANSETIPESVLNALANDTKRNIKILDVVLSNVAESKFIIVFACSVENAIAIHTLLNYRGVASEVITSDTMPTKRQNSIESFKRGELQVLVNYGVLTTGFDAPKTNVAVIARPTNSLTLYSQMVGRASRGIRSKGNKECDIYTVIDELPGFKDMTKAFSFWDDAWNSE